MVDHSHGHPAHLAHHFHDPEQQRDSARLGMWLFLLTEMLLFGGLFLAYSVFRVWNPDMFMNAHRFLNVSLGTLNTAVLIVSSVTMALAVRSLQVSRPKQAATMLMVTLLLAAVFLVVKYFEYSHKIHLGQLPGKYYTFEGIAGDNPHIFFSIYFAMTGLHGIHVIGGMVVIGWMLHRTMRGDFFAEYSTPVELAGLYWHLVDLIWIFLFPLLYLIG